MNTKRQDRSKVQPNPRVPKEEQLGYRLYCITKGVPEDANGWLWLYRKTKANYQRMADEFLQCEEAVARVTEIYQ